MRPAFPSCFDHKPCRAQRALEQIRVADTRAGLGGSAFPKMVAILLTLAGLAQTAGAQNTAPVQLVGVGSSIPLELYSLWWHQFEIAHSGVQIKYLPFGSGDGVEAIVSGTADFGGTDIPLSEKQLAKAGALQFATVLGALVPIYNLPGISGRLRFSSQALAGIYLGTITKWNDPAIAGPNPGVQLPSGDIVVVHSANRRGSTFVWSDYLSKVNVEWRTRIGRGITIPWPVGRGAQGHDNQIKMVKETPNSIGYVEVIYALQNGLRYGLVQNAAGNFVAADFANITAAAIAAAKAMPAKSYFSIVNAPGPESYPISSFTWILVSQRTASSAKQERLKALVYWILNEGQGYAEASGFAKLPAKMVEEELAAVDRMQ